MKKKFSTKILLCGMIVGTAISVMVQKIYYKKNNNIANDWEKKVNKYKDYYNILNQWIALKNIDIKLETYLKDAGINSIGIYGMGEIGNRLYEELSLSSIDVKFGIDNWTKTNNSGFEITNLRGDLPAVDGIIVTPVFDYKNISQEISNYIDTRIISIKDVVFNDF